MLTIRPKGLDHTPGSTACTVWYTPLRLTSMTFAPLDASMSENFMLSVETGRADQNRDGA